MNVSFMSDVEDRVDHLFGFHGLPRLLGFLVLLSQELVSELEGFNLTSHLVLH